MMNKKGALEMSIGTIVIIVISVTMLILGLVLVRTIMCGALTTSLDLTSKMKGEINKMFQETGNDVVLLKGTQNIISVPPGDSSAIWFAFKPDVLTEYNYEFSIYLADAYRKAPYNLREAEIKTWFTTPLTGRDSVGVNGKEKNLIIKPPKDTPQFEFTLKLKVNNEDREEVQIKIEKQSWAYTAFC